MPAPTPRCPVPHMQAGVDRYLNHGVQPGSFLTALFSNDLKRAFGKADEANTAAMREWVGFMYNDMPSTSQGSLVAVRAWIARFAARSFAAIRRMALAVISLTAEHGTCTEAALIRQGFFTTDQVADLHELACEWAGEMCHGVPFVVVRTGLEDVA